MARFVEPIVINGINKDVAPNGLDYSGRKVINPVRDVLNGRYFSSESDEEFQVENIKGTEEVTDILAKRSLLKNSEFNGTINPWVNMGNTGPSDVSWVHNGSGAVTISSSSASVINTKILAQGITSGFISGTEINIDISATILSGFSGGLVLFGYFYNASDSIIQSFSIGVVPSGGSTALLNTNKTVPSGAVKIGLAFSASPGGVSSVLSLNRFKVNGFSTSMPDGINECIGTYENIEKNILIFFNWNSNGLHGVFKYDSIEDKITQLLSDDSDNPVLKFSNNPRYAITGIGMIGDILTWTDNLNPQRYINITRDYGTNFNDFTISLIKIGPRKRPTFSSKQTDNLISANNLDLNSFQFACRYVYLDGEVSVFSPFSDLMLAETIPNLNNKTRAYTNVTHYVDSDVAAILKYVQLVFRKNNDDNWYIWKSVAVTPSTISVTEAFYNQEIGTLVDNVSSTKIFDSVPNKSKALTIFKGRVFLNINEEGFEHESGVIFNTYLESVSTIGPAFNKGPFLKKHGKVRVGYISWDKFGRASLVATSSIVYGVPWEYSSPTNLQNQLYIDSSNTSNVKVQASLSKLPSFSLGKSIVMSDEIVYESYFQTLAIPFLFVKNFTEGTVLTSNEVLLGNRVYLKALSNSSNVALWSKLHLLISKESPFVPDNTYSVRLVKFTSGDISSTILRVNDVIDGDIIVVDGTDFTSIPSNVDVLLIEIFKVKESQEPFFYEVSEPFINVAPTPFDIGGNNYLIGASNGNNTPTFTFRNIGFSKTSYLQDNQTRFPSQVALESISPTKIEKYITEASDLITVAGTRSFSFDLSKKAWLKGRPFVGGIQRLINRGATIRFSDVYIEGSEINGLNGFPVENIYDKIGQDRSSIMKLVAVGNILLAVHERQVTTLYIGEGIVRTGETGFLSKVDSVVGDDRKLLGDYGSYHPESIQEVSGQVFGFDIFNGVVWRYTVEGLYAVSDNGMKNFFRDKSADYFDAKDSLKFVSSVDKFHKEYLITLPNKYDEVDVNGPFDISSTTGSFDIPFNDDFEVGKTYRVKIFLLKQSNTSNDTVEVDVLMDGTTPINENIDYIVSTMSEGSATPVYVEFVYSGEDFIRINVSGVASPIFLWVYRQYQEIEGETWAFNYEKKMWSHRTSIVPEFMGRIGNKVYAFKEGYIHKLNVNNIHNNFLGRQFERSFNVECNPRPNEVKVWSALQIAAESLCDDEASAYKVFDCENNQGQASYTRAKEFEKKEGVYYAPILKDVNTNPLLIGAGRIALRDGKDMRSKSLSVTIRNDRTDQCLLQKVNLIGEKSEFST